jgi:hypothetical protein
VLPAHADKQKFFARRKMKMKRNYGLFFGFTVLLMAAIAILAGCGDSNSGDPTSPPGEDPAKVATPTASPAAGVVDAGTEITLSTSTSGATIRYTTDGSNPTSTTGTEYVATSKPAITADMTIKAIAYKDGMTDSDVLTAAYAIPIEISTLIDLNAINANAENLSKSYKLTADITGVTTPIGNVSGSMIPFTGDFDGNGHTVTLTITSGSTISEGDFAGTFAGLFAAAGEMTGNPGTRGLIHDLTVDGTITISGSNTVCAGGVVGMALPTAAVSNVVSSVTVTASGDGSGNVCAGGIVGVSQSMVSNVYATGNVSATSSADDADAGGVVGSSNNFDIITNAYTTGNVSATGTGTAHARAGGVVGGIHNNGGTLSYAYATGNVTVTANGASSNVGGIVGSLDPGSARNTVALNSSVSISGTSYEKAAHRVIGRVHEDGIGSTMADNYGKADLTPSGGTGSMDKGADQEDGADVTVTPGTPYTAPGQTWWTNTGFSGADWTTVWQWDSAKGLPVLQ